MKVKINVTQATTAILYNDGSNTIKDFDLIGKLSMSGAKKAISSMDVPNMENFSVMKIEKKTVAYDVDEKQLFSFLSEHGTVIPESEGRA